MISETVEYSEKDHEVFEVYSRFRLDGLTKQQALITLMEMEYKITPKLINAFKKYDKYIYWSFYS